MPEGPEIRRAADRLHDAVAGQVAERVRLTQLHLRPRAEELCGRRILSIRPRGKALLTRFEGDLVLYSHNQLYGRWYVCAPERPPRTNRTLRASLETPERWALLYSASDIEVLYEEELGEHPFLRKLGPDLLEPETTPARLRERLLEPRFRRRSFGGLLLDQGFAAGIGNYLRSEILFFAGLRPEQRAADLDPEQLGRLTREMRRVIQRSYRTGGVTETAALAASARAASEPRRSWRHAVFGRTGANCRRCETPIQRLVVASRRLDLCPRCQPASG